MIKIMIYQIGWRRAIFRIFIEISFETLKVETEISYLVLFDLFFSVSIRFLTPINHFNSTLTLIMSFIATTLRNNPSAPSLAKILFNFFLHFLQFFSFFSRLPLILRDFVSFPHNIFFFFTFFIICR